MFRFTVSRILWFIPTILAMTAVTFVIMSLTHSARNDR
jgi:ABC-type dipeptide/oligopeptide/nickel transport system permease component